ncbi:hypothetical protein O7632_20755 [Solwaraspora sp. WMMD406]|uniref:hypothetical protein n=1 Tax=Solwaraspora sp. WMMD406 TaxID=3016095 RepID=UPI0024159AD9|nr:hypothetical protein [Solwaraspora sp. WMMD406]MDG4766510.1 hypothetical protein [Solwaraspora sp. WMMD406]
MPSLSWRTATQVGATWSTGVRPGTAARASVRGRTRRVDGCSARATTTRWRTGQGRRRRAGRPVDRTLAAIPRLRRWTALTRRRRASGAGHHRGYEIVPDGCPAWRRSWRRTGRW